MLCVSVLFGCELHGTNGTLAHRVKGFTWLQASEMMKLLPDTGGQRDSEVVGMVELRVDSELLGQPVCILGVAYALLLAKIMNDGKGFVIPDSEARALLFPLCSDEMTNFIVEFKAPDPNVIQL